MNLRLIPAAVLILAAAWTAGCAAIPTNLPIPSDIPDLPTFPPAQDGDDPATPPPDDGEEPDSPPAGDGAQPTSDGSIPVTGNDNDADGTTLLIYALFALLGVIVLFGFMALLRKPDRSYSERATGPHHTHDE